MLLSLFHVAGNPSPISSLCKSYKTSAYHYKQIQEEKQMEISQILRAFQTFADKTQHIVSAEIYVYYMLEKR